MLKLCGFPASNYHNKVKLTLLEKGIPFEEVLVYPSGEPKHLENTPMGKLPYLDTGSGLIRESQVIDEYIEDVHPQSSLYPKDAMARARCRELIQFIELYIEWPARRMYGEAFFGGKVSDEVKTEVGKQLDKGMRAIGHLAKFQPYIAGAEFTLADIVAAMHFPLAAGAVKVVLGRDLMEPVPGLKPYLKMLGERPHFQTVSAARKADVEALAERRKAAAPAA
jgi:glutathione S-transferase